MYLHLLWLPHCSAAGLLPAHPPFTHWPRALPLAPGADTLGMIHVQDTDAQRPAGLCLPCSSPGGWGRDGQLGRPLCRCLSWKSRPHPVGAPCRALQAPNLPPPMLLWALAAGGEGSLCCQKAREPGNQMAPPQGCGWCLTAFLLEKYGVKNCVGLIRQPPGPGLAAVCPSGPTRWLVG